ncbi:hypothetical protein AB2L28_14165 [Kineococcus sp. TBRC 1896]|uniref:Uncharacterized protein n=1 Tax=Kineococcus mangrovi TaxID=1660183 RepID=A0ABV4I3Y7_9ACTN
MTGEGPGGEPADDLLAGPRGRRLLSALVGEGSDAEPWAWSAHEDDLGLPGLAPLPDPLRTELRERLRRAVSTLDLDALRARSDPRDLLTAFADSVAAARYWQDPDPEDRALADPELVEVLRPVARAVAAGPAARWWSDPVDVTAQQHLWWRFEGRDGYRPIVTGSPGAAAAAWRGWRTAVDAEEERWRTEFPRHTLGRCSGTWWSTPPDRPELPSSTPVLPGGLGVGMTLIEDEMGIEEVDARALRLRDGLRVHEVHDAADWCALVAAHPRSVTFTRRHDWWLATGWDGAWALPDWASVAREWDGVHLSARGYLAVSGRVLETAVPGNVVGADTDGVRPGPARTLLAGWNPGVTHWLTDAVTEVEPPVRWRSLEDRYPLEWAPSRA